MLDYKNSKKIVLTLIDGKGVTGVTKELEVLEKGNPAFNLKQYEIEHDDTIIVLAYSWQIIHCSIVVCIWDNHGQLIDNAIAVCTCKLINCLIVTSSTD